MIGYSLGTTATNRVNRSYNFFLLPSPACMLR